MSIGKEPLFGGLLHVGPVECSSCNAQRTNFSYSVEDTPNSSGGGVDLYDLFEDNLLGSNYMPSRSSDRAGRKKACPGCPNSS